jgi:hypothetical protein
MSGDVFRFMPMDLETPREVPASYNSDMSTSPSTMAGWSIDSVDLPSHKIAVAKGFGYLRRTTTCCVHFPCLHRTLTAHDANRVGVVQQSQDQALFQREMADACEYLLVYPTRAVTGLQRTPKHMPWKRNDNNETGVSSKSLTMPYALRARLLKYRLVVLSRPFVTWVDQPLQWPPFPQQRCVSTSNLCREEFDGCIPKSFMIPGTRRARFEVTGQRQAATRQK